MNYSSSDGRNLFKYGHANYSGSSNSDRGTATDDGGQYTDPLTFISQSSSLGFSSYSSADASNAYPGCRPLNLLLPVINQAAKLYNPSDYFEKSSRKVLLKVLNKPELIALTNIFKDHAPKNCKIKLTQGLNKPELADNILDFLYHHSKQFQSNVQNNKSSLPFSSATKLSSSSLSAPTTIFASSSSSLSSYPGHDSSNGMQAHPHLQKNNSLFSSPLMPSPTINGIPPFHMFGMQHRYDGEGMQSPNDSPENRAKEDQIAAEECIPRELGDRDGECKVETESALQIYQRCSKSTKARVDTLQHRWGYKLDESIMGLRLNGGNISRAAEWIADYVEEKLVAKQMDTVAVESESVAATQARKHRESELAELEASDVVKAGIFKSSVLAQEFPKLHEYLNQDSFFMSDDFIDLNRRPMVIELLRLERQAIEWYGEIAKSFAREAAENLINFAAKNGGELTSDDIEEEKNRWQEIMFSLTLQKGGTPKKMIDAYDRECKNNKKRSRGDDNDAEVELANEEAENNGRSLQSELSSPMKKSRLKSDESNVIDLAED